MLSLLENASLSLSTGEDSAVDPADALRDAMVFSAVLDYAPDPTSATELKKVQDLKVRTYAGQQLHVVPGAEQRRHCCAQSRYNESSPILKERNVWH